MTVEAQDTPLDTVVDVQVRRRRRLPRRHRMNTEIITRDDGGQRVGAFSNPGDTLRVAPARAMSVRETMVRRNHSLQARPSIPPPGPGLVEVDWVRSRDGGVQVRKIHRDTLQIQGQGTGGTLSVGVEGLIYTVAVRSGQSAMGMGAALAGRLRSSYLTEIVCENANLSTLRLTSHT